MLSDEFAKMIAKIKNDFYLEGIQQGKQQGKQEGIQEGMQKGKLAGLYDLVTRGRLTSTDAAEEANMPISVFMEKMAEYNSTHAQA